MSYREWWQGLPRWLRLINALVAIPAWLVIVFCVLVGESASSAALFALGCFAFASILNLIFDRRKRFDRWDGEFDFGGDD
jgi:hypothetical protein